MGELQQRRASVNGVELEVLEAGDPTAPPLILAHGFPEGAWSWRHQLPALADAGYHVLAPYQRGYGDSSRPDAVADYGIRALCDDLLGLLDETGHEQAVFVGHDWGAFIVWDLARLEPERVKAVVGVSVPFTEWPMRPTDLFRAAFGDHTFFYMLYFQEVGPAEAELGADPRDTMARVLWAASGDGMAARLASGATMEPRPPEGTGFLTGMDEPPPLPWSWLTEADLDRYTAEFTRSGFFGPVSYYRNLDANFDVVHDLPPSRLTMPSGFIGGALDPVLAMTGPNIERMKELLPGYRGATTIEGAGHWTQQERPDEFNAALLGFLGSL
jgi:pimeloyl-ACP methyl ester carboxylesterase